MDRAEERWREMERDGESWIEMDRDGWRWIGQKRDGERWREMERWIDPFVSICVCVRVCVYVGAHGHFITNGCSILYTVLMSRRVDTLTGLTVHFQMFFATRASEVGAPGIERQQEDICPLFTT